MTIAKHPEFPVPLSHKDPAHAPYITTTIGSGYMAVMLWWNDEEKDIGGFWEPWDTGTGRYATPAEAEAEGRQWAEQTGVQFRVAGLSTTALNPRAAWPFPEKKP